MSFWVKIFRYMYCFTSNISSWHRMKCRIDAASLTWSTFSWCKFQCIWRTKKLLDRAVMINFILQIPILIQPANLKFSWPWIKVPGNTQHHTIISQSPMFSSPASSYLRAEATQQPGCIVLSRQGNSGEAGLSCILQHPEKPLPHPNTSHPHLLDFVPPE